MIIQKLLFMTSLHDEDLELYFRDTDISCAASDSLAVPAGSTVSLETYFNSFSVGKWVDYTGLDNLTLTIEHTGQIEVKAYSAVGIRDKEKVDLARSFEEKTHYMSANRRELAVENADRDGVCRVSFRELPAEGICYVTVTAVSDARITGGGYETEVTKERLNDVDLALCICTFRREHELKRNLDAIVSGIFANNTSPAQAHTEVYISDNGQTLPEDFAVDGRIHIYKNKNAGGAGGFTRTMIESVFRNKGIHPTHVILMDDDIELDPAIIDRTYNLLRLLKDDHRRAIVGGAMMEKTKRYMQFENGASWKGIGLASFNHEWDMRHRDAVAVNELYNTVNYTGWWYCCIPTCRITEDNLPMPMFIHYDDIEYGQRNSDCGVILLNGMCVWHPYGNNKQPISMNYYDERNILIAMSGKKDRADKAKLVDHLARVITRDVIRYNYEGAETCYDGIEDFFKGPEYFMTLDPIEQHKKVGAKNHKYTAPGPEIDLTKMRDMPYEDFHRLIPLWEVVCYLLPAYRKLQIVSEKDIGYAFHAKNLYLYDRNRHAGMMTVKSWRRTFALIGRFFALSFRILTGANRTMNRWKDATPQFTNLAFWERYLGLDEAE